MNKKGFLLDGVFLIFIFISFLLEFLIIGFVFSNINSNMLLAINATNMVDNDSYAAMDDMLGHVDNVMTMDWVVVFGLFGLFLALIISLYYVRSNPLFAIIGIISTLLLVFLAIIFKDLFVNKLILCSILSKTINMQTSKKIIIYLAPLFF